MSERFLDILNGNKVLEGAEKVHKPIPVINLHPALPGTFDGANAIERAFEAFQKGDIKRTGVMVHKVIKEVDRGEPVVVQEVEMKDGEPLEEFESRLHKVEWEGYQGTLEQDTWQVLDDLNNSSYALADFHRRYPDKPRDPTFIFPTHY